MATKKATVKNVSNKQNAVKGGENNSQNDEDSCSSTDSEIPEFDDLQIKECIEWFDHFKKSKENNTSLDKPGFRKALAALGWSNITGEKADAMFDTCDIDNNGFIDKEEYIKLLHQFRKDPETMKLQLIEEFRHFDKDRSGFIDKTEMMRIMLQKGMNPSRKDIEKMIMKADKRGEGKLNVDEYVEVMMGTPGQ